MSAIWRYLDKRSATINALRDFENMNFIISHTNEEIKAVRERMEGVGSPAMDDMPKAHNPQATEDRIVAGIEKVDILQERYRQATEYMEWFSPAWEQLSEDERYVLGTFYSGDNGYGSNAVVCIAERFDIDRNAAYKRKNRALEHLTILLFGKT